MAQDPYQHLTATQRYEKFLKTISKPLISFNGQQMHFPKAKPKKRKLYKRLQLYNDSIKSHNIKRMAQAMETKLQQIIDDEKESNLRDKYPQRQCKDWKVKSLDTLIERFEAERRQDKNAQGGSLNSELKDGNKFVKSTDKAKAKPNPKSKSKYEKHRPTLNLTAQQETVERIMNACPMGKFTVLEQTLQNVLIKQSIEAEKHKQKLMAHAKEVLQAKKKRWLYCGKVDADKIFQLQPLKQTMTTTAADNKTGQNGSLWKSSKLQTNGFHSIKAISEK